MPYNSLYFDSIWEALVFQYDIIFYWSVTKTPFNRIRIAEVIKHNCGFPGAFGAMDAALIHMKTPAGADKQEYTYVKEGISCKCAFVLQFIVDHRLLFRDIHVDSPATGTRVQVFQVGQIFVPFIWSWIKYLDDLSKPVKIFNMYYKLCILFFFFSFPFFHLLGITSLGTPPKSFKCRDPLSCPSHVPSGSCYHDATCERCPFLPGKLYLLFLFPATVPSKKKFHFCSQESLHNLKRM